MASTTTRRPTPARKKTAPRVGTAGNGPAFEPVRIAADEDVIEEREPLFYIGATEYTIPKTIPMGAALEYLRLAGERGEQLAAPILLTRVLGEEAYMALEKSKGLTEDQLGRIVDHVVDRALGRPEKEGKAETP